MEEAIKYMIRAIKIQQYLHQFTQLVFFRKTKYMI